MNRMRGAGAATAIGMSLCLAGCASAPLPQAMRGAPPAPRESFSYQAASDRDIRVTVGEVLIKGDPDFIPADPNWLQVRVTVANVGSRTIRYQETKERLADGRVVAGAQSATELMKAPDYVKTAGVGTAGIIAGGLLFPPAALIGGAVMAFGPMFQANRSQHLLEKVQQAGLHPGAVAPGTTVSGFEFVPAVSGQTGLIVFYEAGGASQSLSIRRSSAAPGASGHALNH